MSTLQLTFGAILREFSSGSSVHLSTWERRKKKAVPHVMVKLSVGWVRRMRIKVPPVSVSSYLVDLFVMSLGAVSMASKECMFKVSRKRGRVRHRRV